MRSRLAELTGTDAGDVELGEDPGPGDGYMADFFGKVDEAKAGISAVKKAAKRIGRITDERMLATSPNEEQGASRELGPLVDRTNATVKQTKDLLNGLAEQDSSLKSSEQRIRQNLASTLARKFGDVCQDYQKAQTRYKDEVKGNVTRQLQIVKPDVTEEEIDTVLRSGGPGQVMRSAILRGAADPVKDAYAHAADRYQDVLKLEQSVAELHQMFLDFALLTEQQGEMLDQIEYQVKAAGEYVEEGNIDIKKAIQCRLCGNQISGAPRHRRDVVFVTASARRRGTRRTHWLISTQVPEGNPQEVLLFNCADPGDRAGAHGRAGRVRLGRFGGG